MTAKELMIRTIDRSLSDLFRNARAMPEDKLVWKPAEANRSGLEILQECAQSLAWPRTMLKPGAFSGDMSEAFAAAQSERESWTTVEACEQAARAKWVETRQFILDYPEDDLDRQIPLPFAPDLVLSVAEILSSPYWNLTYHLGQLNYVQLMYGDREMH